MRVSFIGSAGIPNRYGGFESFVENCAPEIAASGNDVLVTCDSRLYPARDSYYRNVKLCYVPVPANGGWSVLHDMVAFAFGFYRSDVLVMLGVSGGLWFPLMRIMCSISNKRIVVNIDGVEWRRGKFSKFKKYILRLFDALAQCGAHAIIYDNPALQRYVLASCRSKATCIAYSGDHVVRFSPAPEKAVGTALTICRIEPENNIEMLIEGAISSSLEAYTIIGNWQYSDYGRALRAKYAEEPRLQMLDSIYDPICLAKLRESCMLYLHGHSVGGTNPSLVEMMFYDCHIISYDCSFNRATAGIRAHYFSDKSSLSILVDELSSCVPDYKGNAALESYTAKTIASQYMKVFQSVFMKQ